MRGPKGSCRLCEGADLVTYIAYRNGEIWVRPRVPCCIHCREAVLDQIQTVGTELGRYVQNLLEKGKETMAERDKDEVLVGLITGTDDVGQIWIDGSGGFPEFLRISDGQGHAGIFRREGVKTGLEVPSYREVRITTPARTQVEKWPKGWGPGTAPVGREPS